MARAIEKGATYFDKLCHKFYDEPKGCGKKTDYVCRLCGGPLETYYCEERLYLVKCADCGTLALVKTANPEDSARVTLARPTLTPPNEALTPYPDGDTSIIACPHCGSGEYLHNEDGNEQNYCGQCGQAIDWSCPPEGEEAT